MLYIVSANYDYNLKCVILSLYNNDTEKLEYYFDGEYKPYFYTKERQNFAGIIKQEQVELYDALNDQKVIVWKVTVDGPNRISDFNKKETEVIAWENHIKPAMQYVYDNNIKMGMPYVRESGTLILNLEAAAEKRVENLVELAKPEPYNKVICEQLARLLEYPAPEFKRVSIDIEVWNEGMKVPSPRSANLPVICVCFETNRGEKYAFVLIQEGKQFSCPTDAIITWFSDEAELLRAVFAFGSQYPFIVTFNGDDFDLPYLMNRALRLGVSISEIPITIKPKEKIAYWKDAIHIDLYKFFQIRSMQNYAFQQKYKNVNLDEVSKALIKKGKIKGEHEWVGEMTYEELITYCLGDANLTIELTTYSDNVVMNLILVLARLGYMPIEMVSRKPISQWIRSFIYYEHVKRGYLIPRSEDIIAMKGTTTTTALVKGKKYKGAIVVNPVAGVHFNVKVGDFASLYPSIMKNWNLGYSTVNCPHGQFIQKMSNDTKRFIWVMLHSILQNKELNIQCQQENLMKLMKNIENETENTRETTEVKTNPPSINGNEKIITNLWKLLHSNFNERKTALNIETNLKPTQFVENQEKNIQENGKIENEKNFANDLLNLKVHNANDVEILMNELLKYTTLVAEETSKEEIFISLLEEWIGKNYSYFVPIVIELLTMYECYSNKVAGMQHWICKKNRAIEGQLIGTLKDLRVKWYKQQAKDKTNPFRTWYSVSEQSIKVICNASYGVFGDETFVLYCPPVPEYVTGIGRWIITQTIKHGQELGLNVIYGDTDSIFIKDPAPEILEELLIWAKEKFDIDFELDKEYRYACLSGRKKNYFGVLKDGTVDVKGLTGKKKHTPHIIRTPFDETKKLLAQVHNDEDIKPVKKAILKLVKDTYTKIKTRNFEDMENLAFHVTASKDIDEYDGNPQHIKAAKQLKAAGYDIGEGSEISFVKTTDKLKVKPTKLAKPSEIDVTKYNEFLKNTFIQILEPLGLDWDRDIIGICMMDRFLY
jgi:DNA polymerase elongation subunit (family B)